MMLTCSSGLSKAKTRTASPTFSSSSSLSVAVYSCTAFTWRRRTNPVQSGRNQRALGGRWTHLVEEPWRKFSISAVGHRALEEEKPVVTDGQTAGSMKVERVQSKKRNR